MPPLGKIVLKLAAGVKGVAASTPPHGGYMIITEKPARASEQRAWAVF